MLHPHFSGGKRLSRLAAPLGRLGGRREMGVSWEGALSHGRCSHAGPGSRARGRAPGGAASCTPYQQGLGWGAGAQEGASAEGCLCPHQVVQMQCNVDWLEERRQWHVRTARGSACSCRLGERQARHPGKRKPGLFNNPPSPCIYLGAPWGGGSRVQRRSQVGQKSFYKACLSLKLRSKQRHLLR